MGTFANIPRKSNLLWVSVPDMVEENRERTKTTKRLEELDEETRSLVTKSNLDHGGKHDAS